MGCNVSITDSWIQSSERTDASLLLNPRAFCTIQRTCMVPFSDLHLCEDVLVECFKRLLPWNNLELLQAVMTFDSRKLLVSEEVPQYDKDKVRMQMKAVKNLLKLIAPVCKLFSKAVKRVLIDFREMFWAWIKTKNCTIEGIHAGIIVFQSNQKTNEMLCEKIQFVSVSGKRSFGWFDDLKLQEKQVEIWHREIENELEQMNDNDALNYMFTFDTNYYVLDKEIGMELMKRLVLSLRSHPTSTAIFEDCVQIVKKFDYTETFSFFDDHHPMINLIEHEIKIAMKVNFKLMNPRLWDLNLSGMDIDRMRGCESWLTRARKKADKKLHQYCSILCRVWSILAMIQNNQDTLQSNKSIVEIYNSQINWFSVCDHVILLLQLREMAIQNYKMTFQNDLS